MKSVVIDGKTPLLSIIYRRKNILFLKIALHFLNLSQNFAIFGTLELGLKTLRAIFAR